MAMLLYFSVNQISLQESQYLIVLPLWGHLTDTHDENWLITNLNIWHFDFHTDIALNAIIIMSVQGSHLSISCVCVHVFMRMCVCGREREMSVKGEIKRLALQNYNFFEVLV